MTVAVYPPIDADHIAQWDLDEQGDALIYTPDPDHAPPWWGTFGPFVDRIGGKNLTLYDTYPESAATKFYEIGAPGPFGGSVIFKGGTGTIERDFLYGLSTPEPASPMTIDLWVRPFALGANANIIQKEYNPAAWGATPTAVQMYALTASGEWGISVAIGGARVFLDAIGHGTAAQHLRLIYGAWNHIGLTYNGEELQGWINGLYAGKTAATGAIDYGSHGLWVLGGSRAIGAAADDAFNGNIGRTRISKVARPLSYFFNSYQGAIVGVGGVVGGGDLVLLPPPITIPGRGPGGPGLGLD